MSKAPLISIVIPTFNRAEDLRRCLHSTLALDCSETEIVVSDNCSPDHTPEVLNDFRDPRVRAFRQKENLGPELNMAFVFEQARGEWVITLTDDDMLMPNAAAILYGTLKHVPDLGFLLSPLRQLDPSGHVLPDHLWIPEASQEKDLHVLVFEPGSKTLKTLFWHGHIFSRWVLRREVIDISGYRNQIGKHLYSPMWITSKALLGCRTGYANQPVAVHRAHNKTHWSYPDDYMYGGVVEMISELLPHDPNTQNEMIILSARRVISQIPYVASFGGEKLGRYVSAVLKIPAFKRIHSFRETFLAAFRTASIDEKARAAALAVLDEAGDLAA